MPFDQNQLPTWNKEGVEPPQSLKDEGWQPSQKPPADYFNWFFNKTFKSLQSLFTNAQHREEKGKPGGYAALNADGKVVNADGSLPGGVTSVNNKIGAVTLSAADVGAETPTGAQEKADAALNEAKAYTDQKLTNLSNNETVQGMQKEIANLNLQLEASQRVPNGYTFGTDGVNIFGMNIDFTKTTAVGALSAGITNIPVQDVTGFKAGQEVTIYDDTNIERVTISGIDPDNKILSVSALTKSYKDGANVARTMAVADTVNKCLKFGDWSTQTTNTVTDATVVASAYDTSGNGGRKLVRLSNGWLVTSVWSNNTHYFYKSTDNGKNWSELGYIKSGLDYKNPISLVNKGNTVYFIFPYNTLAIVFGYFDATTVSVGDITSNAHTTFVDINQTAINNVSLAINSAGTELHAAWASKNSTYPYSFNIRYAKGTINADGSVTWSAVTQVTTVNTTGVDIKNPSIAVQSNGNVFIAFEFSNGSSTYGIGYARSSNGSTWSTNNVGIYNGGSYAQSSPSACVAPNGRIWVAWEGKDSTDTVQYNIRVSYSDDGGTTWSSMQKLTSGNAILRAQPSITANRNNEVFIVYKTYDGTNRHIEKLKYSGGSWSSIIYVKNTTVNDGNPSTLLDPTLDFSEPLFIYRDTSKVGFYGTWTEGTTAPLLENDIRFTVKNTDEVVAWAERDELAGFTINATLNGQAMTKTSVSGEDQFTATLPSVQPAELRLTMTRDSTNDDVKITKILGGVA